MAIDHSLLYDPLFTLAGVPAVLTLADGRVFNITVIDKTSPASTGNKVDVETTLPTAAIRYAELVSLGMNADDIVDGTLAFNSFTWLIRNRKLDPNPSGEKAGQILAMLTNQTELASSES
jgi:hypothetical protein